MNFLHCPESKDLAPKPMKSRKTQEYKQKVVAVEKEKLAEFIKKHYSPKRRGKKQGLHRMALEEDGLK
jgi:hypothetical protein